MVESSANKMLAWFQGAFFSFVKHTPMSLMHFNIAFEEEIFCNFYRLLIVTPDRYRNSYGFPAFVSRAFKLHFR